MESNENCQQQNQQIAQQVLCQYQQPTKQQCQNEQQQQQELVQVTFFRPQTSSEKMAELKENYYRRFYQEQWSSFDQNYEESEWHELFKHIGKTEIWIFGFSQCSINQKIFKDISHINMEKLNILQLALNKIQSIQALAYINAPNLRCIILQKNQIANVKKSLSKMYFRKLSSVNFIDNHFQEVDLGRITIAYENSFVFSFLDLTYVNGEDYRRCSPLHDISFLAKDEDFQVAHSEVESAISKDEQKKIQSQLSSKKSTKTLRFDIIVKFFQKMASLRGVKKGNYLREFLKTIFKCSRQPAFVYSIIRLLLPSDDRDRGNYGLKQKGIAKVISDCLGLKKQDYERLYHYKNPNFHQRGFGIGDFSLCVFDIARNFCKQKSQLTVMELNIMLDQLALSNGNYSGVFRQLFQKCNAEEIKWIVRIILKDLKLSIKLESVLNAYHKDAYDFFNLTNSLFQACKKFQNPNISLDDEISVFSPIRPMLAGKKSINYFKYLSHPYFIETKYDGQRIQAHYDGTQIKLFSRNAVNYSHVYKQIIDILKPNIQADACILDGQIIVLQKQTLQMVPFGMNKVVALSNNQSDMQLCYKVFDVLWIKIDGQEMNMMKTSLKDRKNILKNTFKEVKGKLEIVTHKVISEFDLILQQFGASIERNEQGIMIKDPQSLYLPKERGVNWLKLKGDYVDGLTDTLDLIIIGGFFGDKSYRQGDSGHWIDKITTFALGVIEKGQDDDEDEYTVYPFCKVGTGYNASDLALLREKLKQNLVLQDGKFYPKNLKSWKFSIQDKPDCWVRSFEKSVLLEIKAAEIITSDSYPTNCTLRFPRVVKIRYDKDWNEALNMKQLQEMRNNTKFAKNMKRLKQQSGSDGQKDSNKTKQSDVLSKKLKKQKGGVDKKSLKGLLLDDFKCVQLGENDLKRSNLFYGLQFMVLPLTNSEVNKHEVQREILLNGGQVVQNLLKKTNYIVADHVDYRLSIYQKQRGGCVTIIKPKYILICLRQEAILPITPLYLTCLPLNNREYFVENFDKYSDSFTSYINDRQLDEILNDMQCDRNMEINYRLIEAIGIRRRREGMKSFCIGLSRLDMIKLKCHGNIIIEKINIEQKLDSIIINDQLMTHEQKTIDSYRQIYPQAKIQFHQDLKAIGIL